MYIFSPSSSSPELSSLTKDSNSSEMTVPRESMGGCGVRKFHIIFVMKTDVKKNETNTHPSVSIKPCKMQLASKLLSFYVVHDLPHPTH